MDELRIHTLKLDCGYKLLRIAAKYPELLKELIDISTSLEKQFDLKLSRSEKKGNGVASPPPPPPPPPPPRVEGVDKENTFAVVPGKDCKLISPRTTMDMLFGRDRVQLSSAKDSVILTGDNIKCIAKIPKNQDSKAFIGEYDFVVVLHKAVPWRKSTCDRFFMQPNLKFDFEIPVRFQFGPAGSEQALKEHVEDTDEGPSMKGSLDDIVSNLFNVVLSPKFSCPKRDVFQSLLRGCSIKCFHKVNDGKLHLLEDAIVFTAKPILFFPFETIADIELGQMSSRYIQLNVVLKDNSCYEFQTISVDEGAQLNSFQENLKSSQKKGTKRKLQESNESGEESDDSSDSDFNGNESDEGESDSEDGSDASNSESEEADLDENEGDNDDGSDANNDGSEEAAPGDSSTESEGDS